MEKSMEGRLVITEDRMKHILGVARKMYQQAKDEGLSENTARTRFLIGYLHDIGYEWGDHATHQDVAAELLNPYIFCDMVSAIRTHGDPDYPTSRLADALNLADMTVDKAGRAVSLEERLDDIRERYGEESETYSRALKVAARLQK